MQTSPSVHLDSQETFAGIMEFHYTNPNVMTSKEGHPVKLNMQPAMEFAVGQGRMETASGNGGEDNRRGERQMNMLIWS